MPEVYSDGTTPELTDPIRVLEVKILTAINAQGGGGGAATWGYVGHYNGVAPNVTPTVAGATAKDLDAPYQLWVWSGTQWT
jgi:hypothetical protein